MRRLASSNDPKGVVTFPARRQMQGAAPGDDLLPRPASMDEPINILIVDDEPKNLLVLETILNDPAYRLVKAESADEALLALLVDQFALLILDIRMPGVTGIELAHLIKERKKTSQIPIIFLTAYYNEDQHVLEGYGAGAVDYLHKPVNPDILRSKVAVFAELYRMQRAMQTSNTTLLAEVTERRRVQEQLRELNNTLEQRVNDRTQELRASAALLQIATDNASVGLVTFDRSLRYQYANPAYCKMFGLSDAIVGKSPSEVFTQKDADHIISQLAQALAGERSRNEVSRKLEGTDEKTNHYLVIYEPEQDADRGIVGVVVVVVDITDRRRAEEHIRLLLNEVNHRSKNVLSVVSAIVQQTTAPSQAEFVLRFSDRIQALAASHDLLAKTQWQSISLEDLVRAQLAHFHELLDARIILEGPPLKICVAAAQSLGMVVHELATNAAKHGALSNQRGRVSITWCIGVRGTDQRFSMRWRELEGPLVAAPDRRGFGSTVITSMAELSMEGEVLIDFSAEGFSWQLDCPISKILDPGTQLGEARE